MKCFVCGSDSPGEVCNQCVRTERNLFHKEWDYKEGFIMKKVENYRVDVSTYRISGTGMISNSEKGLMARLDAFNHYVGNVISVEKKPYNGKDAVAIHYKNPETQMEPPWSSWKAKSCPALPACWMPDFSSGQLQGSH